MDRRKGKNRTTGFESEGRRTSTHEKDIHSQKASTYKRPWHFRLNFVGTLDQIPDRCLVFFCSIEEQHIMDCLYCESFLRWCFLIWVSVLLRTFVLILVVLVVFLTTFRPNNWGHRYKTQHSYPRSRLITWRRPEMKIGRNIVRKTTRTTKMRTKVRNKINPHKIDCRFL